MTTTHATLPTVKLVAQTSFDIHDKTKEGWTILEDTPLLGEPVLNLDSFLREGERSVRGNAMFKRATTLGSLAGQVHAESLLSMHEKIPEEWRAFYLVFPGTLWRSLGGFPRVPCLYWEGDRWCLDWPWLGIDWYGSDRIVRCK